MRSSGSAAASAWRRWCKYIRLRIGARADACCAHEFCIECVVRYIEGRDGAVLVPCPKPGCCERATVSCTRRRARSCSIDIDVFDACCVALCQSAVGPGRAWRPRRSAPPASWWFSTRSRGTNALPRRRRRGLRARDVLGSPRGGLGRAARLVPGHDRQGGQVQLPSATAAARLLQRKVADALRDQRRMLTLLPLTLLKAGLECKPGISTEKC
ncbi:putative E3 ubiquitin-protein ligase ARI9 [Panicum miliaceum]|uniref:E3 ubiquitin-protein ligase ARI9 n=1 Tax=Panicum miliaceum TaxID=4540 RepID=A0A3L6TBE2_PANMI|nr:putative E3 ubiquitin-protein ligase ARI9 [Panicum miliaceum]